MHRAGLANETRPEFLQNPIGIDQDAAEALDIFRVVGGVMPVLIERSGVVELDRRAADANLDAKRPQARHVLAIKIRNRARVERNVVFVPSAGSDGEPVRGQVELY